MAARSVQMAGIVKPRAYVHQSIDNIAIERLRRAKIADFHQFVEADCGQLYDDGLDQCCIAAGKEALKRFSDKLFRLPDRCREVFFGAGSMNNRRQRLPKISASVFRPSKNSWLGRSTFRPEQFPLPSCHLPYAPSR